ncbi:DUF3775 domain-containing protein [Dichotomicrobium thermohalophilum]|uniref:Uncharacterized protein DUF3775 n=1 Tax=Dichotomicrobium thermohalophilum TaxID=933063 RepID=A0A397Q6R7_9HYPH|nr:DUF3775 domain-containing protein [Dichotomicrobium thermohalophilum]RIA56169.1 uncharacterized protein DUF3775 [Dichotomicrobium thermohalophilum]
MLGISTNKVAYIILKAREWDVKTQPWQDADPSGFTDYDNQSILEDISNVSEDATRTELSEFIGGLNEDEKARLVALVWVGRGTYDPADFEEAVNVAKSEDTTPTENYLLGIPLLPDFLEEGLSKMGVNVDEVESDIM